MAVVDQVLAEVVAVGRRRGRVDVVVVVDELGVELVGLAVEEAVEAVEARAGTATGRTGPAAEASSIWHRCHLPTAKVA